jgi:hypothetical protein
VQDWLADEQNQDRGRHSTTYERTTAHERIEPRDILEHLLQVVKVKHADRYGALFEEHDSTEIVDSLGALLRPEALAVI